MWHADNEKQKRQITEGIVQSNQEIIRTLGEKETDKYLGILEVETIKLVTMKKKKKRRVSQTNEKTSRTQRLQQESHQRD